ncbi:hypothetical protein ALC152_19870 [Arcobacter sp. 15-2]|uniref:SIR2 family NAD-dependent protein deacylase n=1 Tax=Arcobacter sp. 15-2 TaxID=3374109 RepID=UPI00399C7CA4
MNKVFDELRELYNEKEQNNLVVFIGAGISENYAEIKNDKSFPSWKKLIDEIKIGNNSTDDFLKSAQIYEDNYSKEALVAKVKELFPKEYNCHDIHKLIYEIEPAHIITTNYDDLLEKAMRAKNLDNKFHVVDTDAQIPLSKSKHNLLVKAHGDLNRTNIVLTEQDYNNYEKNFPLILSFIRYVFSKYKVLFLGFSLSDPNFNKILYWVKNILEENTIKHTVILHSDISKSEKIHFEKKSVNVITQSDISLELTNEKKDNYLKLALNFIKYGYPSHSFLIEKRLDILKDNLKELENFNYLLPSIANTLILNTNLEFRYEENAEKYNDFNKKMEKHYPWSANIIGIDNSINNNHFNFYITCEDKDKLKKLEYRHLLNLSKLFIYSNISSIGSYGEIDVLDLLKEEDKNNLNSYLTYIYTTERGKGSSFNDKDKSFENKSLFYKSLIFKEEDFFSDYILGNKEESYKKCKNTKYDSTIKKYLTFYRLHFLFNNRRINDFEELDSDSFLVYEDLFNTLNKFQQKILTPIHKLKFIEDYFHFISDFEHMYKKFLEKNKYTRELGGWTTPQRYSFSLYINYSRLLKFIILNKLPILHHESVQKIIHKSNIVYLDIFFNPQKGEEGFTNWYLLGFLFDNNTEDFRSKVIEIHLKYLDSSNIINFDKNYIKELLSHVIKFNKNSAVCKTINLFYILSLTTKNEENFLFILNIYYQAIQHEIENIEVFAESIHIGYVNYTKHNELSENVKNKLVKIFNLYIKFKLDMKIKGINDDKFSYFIFSIDRKIKGRDKEVLNILNSEIEDIQCKNLSAFIYLLKQLGYKKKDIKRNIIKRIKNKFNKDFYADQVDPRDKCPNQIENSIIRLAIEYSIDLGIKDIEEHYTQKLLANLQEKGGISSIVSDSIGWLIFLIDNKLSSKKFYKSINSKKLKNKLLIQLSPLLESSDKLFLWGNSQRNLIINFLIKTNNIKIILNSINKVSEKDKIPCKDIFISIFEEQLNIGNYKKDLIKLSSRFYQISKDKNFLMITHILSIKKDIDSKNLKLTILNILKDTKKDI